MRNKIYLLILIVLMFITSNVGAVTYEYTVRKDVGTNTPLGTENPNVIDNAIRQLTRLDESDSHILTLLANGTASTTDTYIIGSSSTGILVSFPSASSVADGTTTKLYVIKNRGAGTITLSPEVDGVGSPTVSQNGGMVLFTNGTTWFELRVGNAATATTASNSLLLNQQNAAYYTNSSNQDAGTLPLARLPATLTGKDADTIDGINGANIVQGTRTITVAPPLTIDGGQAADLSVDRVINVATSTASVDGILKATDFTTFNNKQNALNGLYLSKWIVSGVDGTGTVELIAGPGTSIVGVDHNGSGSITVTAVGTASAAGWVDTGTQTQSIQGYPIDCRGTLTISSTYGISGMLDSHIPNTITLDNITQITTRNLSDMQGTLSLGTQATGAISTNAFSSGLWIGYAYGSVTTFTATVTSGAYIANDNTIPQSSEGIEILTLNYTPVYATSTIKVNAVGNLGTNDDNSYSVMTLFLGTETNARATAMVLTTEGGIQEVAPIPAGFCITNENHGTNTLTFKMRGGSTQSGSNNFYVNGGAGMPTAKFGGTLITYLEAFEIK